MVNTLIYKATSFLFILLLAIYVSAFAFDEDICKFKEICNEMGTHLLKLGDSKKDNFDVSNYIDKLEEASKGMSRWPEEIRVTARKVLDKAKNYQGLKNNSSHLLSEENSNMSLKERTAKIAELVSAGKSLHRAHTELTLSIYQFFKATPEIVLPESKHKSQKPTKPIKTKKLSSVKNQQKADVSRNEFDDRSGKYGKIQYVTGAINISIRSGPSWSDKIIATLSSGDRVRAMSGPNDGWVKVLAENGVKGWSLSAHFISPPDDSSTMYVKNVIEICLYDTPAIGSKKLATLETGDEVRPTGEKGIWLAVITPSGEKGWVYKRFIVESKPSKKLPWIND